MSKKKTAAKAPAKAQKAPAAAKAAKAGKPEKIAKKSKADLAAEAEALEAAKKAAAAGEEEDAEDAEDRASGGGNSNAEALAAASGSGEISASLKNFRHHPDMENFYRFIYENDLRLEALAILDDVLKDKALKKQSKTASGARAK